jgi:DNA helicase INO80
MNLVMQFRKVCNHPELFERADVTGPLSFASFAHSASLTREGDLLHCPDSVTNGIELHIPKLLAREGGLTKTPGWNSRAGFDTKYLDNMFNIWRQPHVAQDLQSEKNSTFSALRLLDLNARDAEVAFWGHSAKSTLETVNRETRMKDLQPYVSDDEFSAASIRPFGWVQKSIPSNSGMAPSILPPLHDVRRVYSENSPLAGPAARLWAGKVVAPPIRAYSNDRPFVEEQERLSRDDLVTQMLYGVPTPAGCEDEKLVEATRRALPKLPPRGILTTSSTYQLPAAQMQVPQINKLIIDSTKLAHLDKLLRDLKANDHRVLIYFQMTKMIDLMEEYLIYRQYKYLRLDGSSKISDRRDMVTDWQTKPELFVFLLSTRAGGLGINLTAADTVVFFDSDWNPSNDQQAMDRAHRLGQTKQVTVYRLITKGTIDERIIKMARNKKEVQDIVVGNKTMNEGGSGGVAKPQEIVSLLMDDDELAEAMLRKRQAEEAATAQGKADVMRETHRKRKANREKALRDGGAEGERGSTERTVGWALDEDEDDFFGAKPPSSKIEEIESVGGNNTGSGEASVPRGPKAGRVPSQQQRKKRSASGPSSRKKKDKDAEGAEGSTAEKTGEGASNEASAEGEASNSTGAAPPPAKKPRKSGKKQAAAAAAAAQVEAEAANTGGSADAGAGAGAGADAGPASTETARTTPTGPESGSTAAIEPEKNGGEKQGDPA